MKSSRTSLAALAALAAYGVVPVGGHHAESQQAFRIPGIRRSKRYPEQSSRQAMRAHRRQQGGLGIALNPDSHQYEPRA